MEEKKVLSMQNKCDGCGANLVFDPKSQDLFCDRCETHYPIIDDGQTVLHDLTQSVQKDKKYDDFVSQNKMFKCPNCGASVMLNQYEISKKCPYCEAGLVIEEDNFPGIKPDAVIPFQFNKEDAAKNFVNGVKKKFFVPNKFKKNMPASDINGIYIPAFGYSAKTTSVYDGELYEEHETKDADGNSTTERTYFKVSGTHSAEFNDVMVESSSKITQAEINGFLPYKTAGRKNYSNQYILGYSVEHYNQTVQECVPTYKSIVTKSIRAQILRKYEYNGVNYLNVSTEYRDEKYLYYLVPVYKFEYEYKKKKYITYMNGQTGRVDNNVPKSGLKIAFAILLPLLIVLIPIIIGIILGAGD